MALITSKSKVAQPVDEKILDAFSYIKFGENYEKMTQDIIKWINDNNVTPKDLSGPYLIINDTEETNFKTYMNKKMKSCKYKSDHDYNYKLLNELSQSSVWKQFVKYENDENTLLGSSDNAFLVLVNCSKHGTNNFIFFINTKYVQ